MAKIADLMIKIAADHYQFTQTLDKTQRKMQDVSKSFTSLGKSMTLSVTAPLMALGAWSVKSADDQIKANAKVQQAIATTGGAAKLTFSQLEKYASELQNKTLFGDEVILNDATAQLLTFTNIAGDNFKRAQMAAMDLATVLDGDLKGVSIQLGKALNDPVKGLTALGRSGIQFSKDQRQTIKALAETNRLAEAQSIILDEINKQYGGQAEARAKAGIGPLKQLMNQLGDLAEEIGAIIIPYLLRAGVVLKEFLALIQALPQPVKEGIVAFSGLAAALGPALVGIGAVVKYLPLLKVGLAALLSPLGIIAAAVMALGAAFAYAYYEKRKLVSDAAAEFEEKNSLDQLNKMATQNTADVNTAEKNKSWRLVSNNTPTSGVSFQYTGNQAEIDQLRIKGEALALAIERKTKAQEESNKAEAEAKKMTDQITAAMAGFNVNTEVATGLIGKLNAQITELNKKKLIATTPEQIRAINTELDLLNNKLSLLNGRQDAPTDPLRGNAATHNPGPKAIDQKSLAGQLVPVDLDQSMSEATARYAEGFNKLTEDIGMITESFTASAFVGLGEGLGAALSGSLNGSGAIAAIGSFFADFLGQVGQQMIMFGTSILGIQEAITTMLANIWNAVGAIGVITLGVALVALSSGIKGAISDKAPKVPKLANGGLAFAPTYAMIGDNPNARIDPEVVAPLSKLKQMMGVQQQAIVVTGELRARGADLAVVLANNNVRMATIR